MQAQNNLAKTQSQQATTFERLSTGLRVNSAKDDAGGLYLAQAQTSDIRGLGMATRNAGDGISLAQTAEGALDQIGQNLQRINELAIQSANGTYSDEARDGLQKEVDQLTQEINRIVETTEFNGQKLLNGDAKSETLQIGFENNAGSRITTGLEGGIESLNGLDNVTFFGAGEDFQNITVDGDGKTTNENVQVAFGNALGFGGGNLTEAGSDDAVGSKIGDAVANALSDFQGDAETLGEALYAEYGTGGGTHTFSANGIDYSLAFSVTNTAGNTLSATDLTADYAGTTFTIDMDGALDTDSADATAATFATAVAAFEVATDALEVKVEDSNALNAIVSDGLTQTKSVDISTQENAQNAITATRNAIDMVSELRAEFGANQNRFEAVISGNQTYSENLSAARSRIQDADFAVETANLAKQQVLQQAGISALGQANASSQAILGLL